MTDESYKKYIDHMSSWIFALPDHQNLLPMLKMRISAKEAEFLSKIPFLPHTSEELSKRLNISTSEFEEKAEEFARRGLMQRIKGSTVIRYTLGDSLFVSYRMPGWEGKNDEWNKKFAPLINEYYTDVYGEEFLGHPTKGLRTIPINETVEDTKTILPYEDVVKIVENFKIFSVAHCACRHRHGLGHGEDHCKHDTENCLHFDTLAKYKLQNGIGREITKEETLEILKKAADAGLVHGISNSLERMDTICNCCACCCLFFEKVKGVPGIAGHQKSNYLREIDDEKCIKCGLCAKKCPMGALEIVGENMEAKTLKFTPELCLGCGVCVHKCPKEAIFLIRRDEEIKYPKDPRETAAAFLSERGRNPVETFKKNL
jgi:ferredoxin